MISIVIVNYNSRHFLLKCLESIELYAGVDYEVVVVDNHSTDNSTKICNKFWCDNKYRLVKLSKNLGFAKANNIGAKESKGNILHFLNPDTELRDGMDIDYKQCIKCPSYIYVNNLQNPDGSFVESKNIIPTIKNLFCKFRGNESYWYTGASVIISKENFNRIGEWNESFFMYSEDLDLFYKAALEGLETRKLPTIITHAGGGSSSIVWSDYERELRVQYSFKRFYIINNIQWQYPVIIALVFIKNIFIQPFKTLFLMKVWFVLNFKGHLNL